DNAFRPEARLAVHASNDAGSIIPKHYLAGQEAADFVSFQEGNMKFKSRHSFEMTAYKSALSY
ncbi:hypothetical protein, partial [Rhizobium rhizogenes]|uniref:hypothetical protein n=1 Tax=Rhizobium rhizogenes TaxID=359 RepID=UPI002271D398